MERFSQIICQLRSEVGYDIKRLHTGLIEHGYKLTFKNLFLWSQNIITDQTLYERRDLIYEQDHAIYVPSDEAVYADGFQI